MAYNDNKIVRVLLGHVKDVPDRYDGYVDDFRELLVDVLQLEREHITGRTNIVQRIGDKVNTVGMTLYRENSDVDSEGEDA